MLQFDVILQRSRRFVLLKAPLTFVLLLNMYCLLVDTNRPTFLEHFSADIAIVDLFSIGIFRLPFTLRFDLAENI